MPGGIYRSSAGERWLLPLLPLGYLLLWLRLRNVIANPGCGRVAKAAVSSSLAIGALVATQLDK